MTSVAPLSSSDQPAAIPGSYWVGGDKIKPRGAADRGDLPHQRRVIDVCLHGECSDRLERGWIERVDVGVPCDRQRSRLSRPGNRRGVQCRYKCARTRDLQENAPRRGIPAGTRNGTPDGIPAGIPHSRISRMAFVGLVLSGVFHYRQPSFEKVEH